MSKYDYFIFSSFIVVFHLEEKTSYRKIHLFEGGFFSDFQLEQKSF